MRVWHASPSPGIGAREEAADRAAKAKGTKHMCGIRSQNVLQYIPLVDCVNGILRMPLPLLNVLKRLLLMQYVAA